MHMCSQKARYDLLESMRAASLPFTGERFQGMPAAEACARQLQKQAMPDQASCCYWEMPLRDCCCPKGLMDSYCYHRRC